MIGPLSAAERFLAAASATCATTMPAAEPAPLPIIDTHLHLYDPTRPQGAPFPKTPNPPPFLPRDYREAATPLGITGGIVVEASPWMEDNLWVLMTIEKEPIIVGLVGCLDPTKPDFREYLDRYHRNKLFLGIRYGNVWEGHNIVAAVENAGFHRKHESLRANWPHVRSRKPAIRSDRSHRAADGQGP